MKRIMPFLFCMPTMISLDVGAAEMSYKCTFKHFVGAGSESKETTFEIKDCVESDRLILGKYEAYAGTVTGGYQALILTIVNHETGDRRDHYSYDLVEKADAWVHSKDGDHLFRCIRE